jgi:FkbM family methyltransferase
MSYSQNREEEYILDYFKNSPPSKLIEIGSFDPMIFSNSRALYELGWNLVLVEPAPKCMERLVDEYANDPKVTLIDAAISDKDSVIDFFEQVNGYAVSTTSVKHKEKWEQGSHFKYKKIEVKSMSMEALIKNYGEGCDFISIDVEDTNYQLLQLIPDSFLQQVKMICIEYDEFDKEIEAKLTPFGFMKLYTSGENLIFAK